MPTLTQSVHVLLNMCTNHTTFIQRTTISKTQVSVQGSNTPVTLKQGQSHPKTTLKQCPGITPTVFFSFFFARRGGGWVVGLNQETCQLPPLNTCTRKFPTFSEKQVKMFSSNSCSDCCNPEMKYGHGH